jgi:formylglycine-generating enzyme required for sulfatase activity
MKKYFWLMLCCFGHFSLYAQRGMQIRTKEGYLQLATEEQRIALVIGNNNYQGANWPVLRNPINDARAMQTVLKSVGFEVSYLENGTRQAMLDSVAALTKKIRSSQTVALLFYAGHGTESDGKNWLVPIDDKSSCRDEIVNNCVSLDYIQNKLKDRGAVFNILISDACRTPTVRFECTPVGRSGERVGFVPFKAKGSFIAFSTAPNQIALDGKGNNSPYTSALVKALETPGLPIESVFKQVAIEMETVGQEPWTSSGFTGEFLFKTVAPRLPKSDFTESATGVLFPMKYITGGIFQMGNNNSELRHIDKPAHTVRVSDFYIGKYEVTVGEYLKFCQATNSNWPEWLENNNNKNVETGSSEEYFYDKHLRDTIIERPMKTFYSFVGYWRTGSEDLPIVGVSWNNAIAYCRWLSTISGKIYRLPTEAEWEYSAKGGETYESADSNYLNLTRWYGKNSDYKPHPVGQKKSNSFGLHDMMGNVQEWCNDYFADYTKSSLVDPLGSATGSSRVVRGGGWLDRMVIASTRSYREPEHRSYSFGFRVVCVSQ